MRSIAFFLCALLVLGLAASGTAAQQKVIAPPGANLDRPFVPAILSGDFLYLSGAIGTGPGGELSDDIKVQTRLCMENLGNVLKAANMDFSNVVSSTVFLADSRHFQDMNEVYREFFPKDPPARATVEADIALPGALAEISMVAARPGLERKVITPEGMARSNPLFSSGILAGNTLYISGMVSREGDTAAQTKQVLENVGAVLEAAGMGYKDVVSCKVFLADARHFQDMNGAYRPFFPEDPPARATVRARLMSPTAKVEIQCTAVRDASRKVVMAEGASPSSSPFSPAIQVGNRLYLSGMMGRGPDGYSPDIKEQTNRTLENLLATLKGAGMDFSNVVDVMVYLSDIRHYDGMNEAYRAVMPTPPPARATVGAPLVSTSGLVEIVMIAER